MDHWTPLTTQGDIVQIIEAARSYCTSCSYSSGDFIISPSQDSQAFYYLSEGTVEVSYTDRHDTRITVALIGAGDFFGEIGFFDGETRVRDIRAVGDVRLGLFDAGAMGRMRLQDPALYMDFLVFIVRKICMKFRRIAGEREPIASYAESLSTKRSSGYAETKPMPASLLNSENWHAINSRVEQCKSALFDLSHQLQAYETEEMDELSEEPFKQRCFTIIGELNDSLADFREHMADTGYEEVMWGYVFKEIFPYFMRSKFAERAYYKPKGYAGDFLMMEHIYANEPKGEGRLGKLIDAYCLQRPGSLAIRGRRLLLKKELMRISSARAAQGQVTRILNLACGPNRELFDFIAECQFSELIEALCIDVDTEALQYTNQHVNIFPHRASIRLMTENVIKWSLGKVQHHLGELDIIYSAGLCDYLDHRLFKALIKRCYEHLKPGGVLLLGNFTHYPDSLFLDKLLRWELIYRDSEELKELFAATGFADQVSIIAEQEHVNLFARATKM